jgi:uncharacterized protein (TIRG00374 family)
MRAPTPLIRFVQGRPRQSQETPVPVPAAADAGLAPPSSGAEDPEESGTLLNRRRVAIGVVFVVAALGGLYFLLPKVAGLNQTWGKLRHGDPWWLALGAVFELLSVAGYALLFRTVFGREAPRVDWRASIQIPLAGIAAIRLLAAAGAGGVAVTAWALSRAGMSSRVIACRMVASYVLQYSVYMGALIVCGVGLRAGLLSGEAPFVLTTIPALLCCGIVALVASMALVPRDFERRLSRLATRAGRLGRLAARFATAPATVGSGVRTALELVRERRVGLLGAVAYWGFDIAVLGVCFRAFGSVVPVAVLIMCYFLGTLGSLLPLPGGVGGVEGGMIGAFVAFGVSAQSAVIGVLAYRALSFWLPTLPGIGGYLALRTTVRRWRAEDDLAQAAQAAQAAQPQPR